METLTDYIVYSGEAIRQARKQKGLTIDRFAKLVQISVGQMSNIETGKRSPRADEISRMKKVLGVPIVVM